ncbi:hypothetical protein [Streptomyces sp. NBC_00690]|uniref:hypothetical protein n=1 Tax=Streptomyces sp. NBC_00690 TaxID=2975808 RepID=UPI002E294329|nr:hypothetical protein [Streptomyces sp. NBC_00690]
MRRSRTTALHQRTAGWSANRRISTMAAVLAVLVAAAGLAAYLLGRSEQSSIASSPTAPASPAPSKEGKPSPGPDGGSVALPPQIADPLAFGKSAAAMLWSYDTRTTSRDQQLAGMRAWMTDEVQYSDWAEVQAQVPAPVLWSRMRDNAQHATATIGDARFPSAFKQALADNPTALSEAYIYAVTVTGKQTISWKDGGGGAEDRSVTLAVQCRPSTDCALVSIAPLVAP